ncbi:MAG: hypothetical protein P0121_02220 [Nitrospira sp.]|nr:hypothetical protein [Nitrospira sp.]
MKRDGYSGMDWREIAPYNRFWREVVSGPPAQNHRRSPASPERKEKARHRSISLFSEKTCPNNGGKVRFAEQTVDTLPDISSVSFIVTGLAQQTQPLTGPAQPASKQSKDTRELEAAPAQTDDEMQLIANRRELDAMVDNVLVANEDIGSVINLVGSAGRPESLENCQVGQVVTGLTVVPSGPIVIGENQSKGIMLTGGKSPYVATLLDSITGDSGDLLVVKQPDIFGPKVMIEGKKGVSPGNYNLYAADAAGHHQLITIVVAKQEPVKGAGSGDVATQQEEIAKAVSEKLKRALPGFPSIKSKVNPGKVTVGPKDGDSQSAVIKIAPVADPKKPKLTEPDRTKVEEWVKAIFKATVTITRTTIDASTGVAKIEIKLPLKELKENLTSK